MSAKKFDDGKPRLDLLSSKAKNGLALVLGPGAEKYGDHNWREGLEWSRLVAAAYRHLDAFNDGEDLDPDDGLPHIDHAQACLHFLSHYFHAREGTDDRYRSEDDRSRKRELECGGSRV